MAEQPTEYDFIIVGSGAGALAAAIRADELGLKTLIIEKSEYYGGSTAMSGGGLWIPNNHDMARAGGADSDAAALFDYKFGIGYVIKGCPYGLSTLCCIEERYISGGKITYPDTCSGLGTKRVKIFIRSGAELQAMDQT